MRGINIYGGTFMKVIFTSVVFLLVLAVQASAQTRAAGGAHTLIDLPCTLSFAPGGKAYGTPISTKTIQLITPAPGMTYGEDSWVTASNDYVEAIINKFANQTYKITVVTGNYLDRYSGKTVMTAESLSTIDVEFPFLGNNHYLKCQ
jgi:hypothetical protein